MKSKTCSIKTEYLNAFTEKLILQFSDKKI